MILLVQHLILLMKKNPDQVNDISKIPQLVSIELRLESNFLEKHFDKYSMFK